MRHSRFLPSCLINKIIFEYLFEENFFSKRQVFGMNNVAR